MGWWKTDSLCGSPSVEPWNEEYHHPDCEEGILYCPDGNTFIEDTWKRRRGPGGSVISKMKWLNFCPEHHKFIGLTSSKGICIGRELAGWRSE